MGGGEVRGGGTKPNLCHVRVRKFCKTTHLMSEMTELIVFPFLFSAKWVVACFMVLGHVVEICVTVVTIVNYCAQCELLIFYLREIGLRMEEKTKDLSIIMKVCTSTSRFMTTLVSHGTMSSQLLPQTEKNTPTYTMFSKAFVRDTV